MAIIPQERIGKYISPRVAEPVVKEYVEGLKGTLVALWVSGRQDSDDLCIEAIEKTAEGRYDYHTKSGYDPETKGFSYDDTDVGISGPERDRYALGTS